MLSVRWKNPVAASLLWRWISQLAYCQTDIKRKFIRTVDRHLTAANLIRQVSAISFLLRSYIYTELDFDENKVQYISSKLWNRSIHDIELSRKIKCLVFSSKQTTSNNSVQYSTLFIYYTTACRWKQTEEMNCSDTEKRLHFSNCWRGIKTVSTRHLTNDSESKNQSPINLNASHTFPRNSIPRKGNTPFQPSITSRKWRGLDSLIIKKRKIP